MTACTPLTTGAAERNKRRKKLYSLSSVQEEHSHENVEDKKETADMITILTG